jgi:TRAP-type C4-dicarboxylate transport system permease small subunit
MNTFEKFVSQCAKVMYHIAGWAIVAMMLITCADVTLRLTVTLYAKYGWALLAPFRPIPGTYELVCFLGSVAAAFAMAHTSVENGHVAVNFITRLFPNRLQAGFRIGTGLLSLILFAIISWRSFLYAQKIHALGEVSMTLRLPFYPFIYGVSLSALAVCAVLFAALFNDFLKVLER